MMNNYWTKILEKLSPAEQVVEIMTRTYNQRLTTPSGGNVSVKDTEGNVWMTPSQIDKGTLQAEDIVCIHPNGKAEGRHKPTSEYPFHLKTYSIRPDVQAIVHAHPVNLVSYCCAGKMPPTGILPEAAHLLGKGKLSRYAIPGSTQLAENIANAIEPDTSWLMMEKHGAICLGKNLAEAFYKLEWLELCAATGIKAQNIGSLKKVSKNAISHWDLNTQNTLDKEEISALRESRLMEYIERAANRGLYTSTASIWSVRNGNSFISSLPKTDSVFPSEEDFSTFSLESCDHPHARIYRNNTDIQSIASTFPMHLMAFAACGLEMPTHTIPESYLMLRDMPLQKNQDIHDSDFLKNSSPHVSFLHQNGPVVISGKNAFEVFDRLEVAEFTARSIIDAQQIGGISPLSKEDIDEIRKVYLGQTP